MKELSDAEFLKQMTAKLPIDMNDLEGEWIRQPGMYVEVGQWCAKLRMDAKQAKQHAEFVYGNFYHDIIQDPNHGGLPKTTEALVKAFILTMQEYREALDAMNEAERLANESMRLLEALEQRKAGLRDLVRLYVHEYYMDSDPKGPAPRERRERGGDRDRGASPQERTAGARFEEADAEMQNSRGRSRRQDRMDDELEENHNG